eukprot:scaffold59458_cov64-Phaeocystis_antarctica.AAC.7
MRDSSSRSISSCSTCSRCGRGTALGLGCGAGAGWGWLGLAGAGAEVRSSCRTHETAPFLRSWLSTPSLFDSGARSKPIASAVTTWLGSA